MKHKAQVLSNPHLSNEGTWHCITHYKPIRNYSSFIIPQQLMNAKYHDHKSQLLKMLIFL